MPTVIRGVIDLVFFEDDGWVIVDYKTDDPSTRGLDALVEHYQGQVLLYANMWQRMAGQPIREVGLYFTHVDRYIAIPARSLHSLLEKGRG
jgi:ATP-dependent helicase/nuclease subunit A